MAQLSRHGTAKRELGFSLVEVLIAVILLGILIPAMLSAFTVAQITVREARMIELAKHIGQLKMETAMAGSPVAEAEASVVGFPGFTTEVRVRQDWELVALEVTVIVRFQNITGQKEHRLVAVTYGR